MSNRNNGLPAVCQVAVRALRQLGIYDFSVNGHIIKVQRKGEKDFSFCVQNSESRAAQQRMPTIVLKHCHSGLKRSSLDPYVEEAKNKISTILQ